MGLKEQFEERRRTSPKVKEVPVGDLTVYVRAITCAEKEAYMKASVDQQPNSIARFVALTLCDETGKRLYEDSEIDALATSFARDLDDIWDEALAFNRMGKDQREKKTDADGAVVAPDSPGVPRASGGAVESRANHAAV